MDFNNSLRGMKSNFIANSGIGPHIEIDNITYAAMGGFPLG